jgi:hypothetical protein
MSTFQQHPEAGGNIPPFRLDVQLHDLLKRPTGKPLPPLCQPKTADQGARIPIQPTPFFSALQKELLEAEVFLAIMTEQYMAPANALSWCSHDAY